MRTIRKTKRMMAKMGPTIQTIDAFFGLGRSLGSLPGSPPFGRGRDGGGPGGSCGHTVETLFRNDLVFYNRICQSSFRHVTHFKK